ncbi:MAG: zinc ribbon domain-containing protein [Chloroflexi bacterium]|nr:zinc ribbon domain-containing protein [Chloroflexota bacterium]
MIIVIAILMAAISVAIVAWPIVQQRRSNHVDTEGSDALAELMERRDSLLAAIKDLEFDYAMGKMAEEDFQVLNAQLRSEAIEVLKQIDQRQGVKPGKAAARLEREISRRRRKAAAPAEDLEAQIEAEIAALRRRSARRAPASDQAAGFCTRCGAPLEEGDRFCGRCGTPVASPDAA